LGIFDSVHVSDALILHYERVRVKIRAKMATLEQETFTAQAPSDVEPESFAPSSAKIEQSRLLIVSYNIRYAVGSYLITGSLLRRLSLKLPRRRPRLVARHIKRAASALSGATRFPRADVIALQEADKETVRAGHHHVARELAHELQMHYAHASLNSPREDEQKPKQWYLDFEERIAADEAGDTGIAILSRLPLLEVERLELPWSECAWRPRLALYARIALQNQVVHIFNLHIDPHASTDEQLQQHSAVIARAAEVSGPTVIMGDFNTLTRNACERVRSFLEERGYSTPLPTKTATWRAGLIRLHPDWIFVRGLCVTRWGVMKPLGVSDHWPVWAEVELEHQA
jgi:endonuclease/exonuclease/phosphatase family metal-dependent hydrolase